MQFIKRVLYLLSLCITFEICYSDTNQLMADKMLVSVDRFPSIRFQVTGNVYPDGYYYVTVNLGNPPKPYTLDIDTGSHFTWIQCDAPCQKCLPVRFTTDADSIRSYWAPHPPYKPVTNQLLACSDPLCAALHWPERPVCNHPSDQCDYYLKYADRGSSLGVVIKDPFTLQYTNGTITKPCLAFGCGYYQSHPDPMHRPWVDGILGLGSGKEGILSQLREVSDVRNIVGLCLGERTGYLFLGYEAVPTAVVWTPMLTTPELSKRYYLGLADLDIGGVTSGEGTKDLAIVFDSGTTYTFFASKAYKALVSMLMNDLKGKELNVANDETLPVCWKGSEPFATVENVKNLFTPITLRFQSSDDTWFEMDPEAYLIISLHGNVCLGILDSTEIGAPHINLIGDISFRDKLIIYDNENQRIGWVPENCNLV